MFALVLALALSSHAASDIEFKSSGPVSILVDGRQATQASPLRHKMSGLDAGVHALKVVGMFGKTLYEAEIDLPDNTITYASWDRGEIKVLSTDWLPQESVAADEAADTGLDEEVVVVEAPSPPAPAEPLVVAAPPPEPFEEMAIAAVEQPYATFEPAVVPLAPVPAAAAKSGRTLTVQAADGMRVEVVHAGQKVVVVVDGDTFYIEDGSGLSMALGTAD